jgi:hypothetical protein
VVVGRQTPVEGKHLMQNLCNLETEGNGEAEERVILLTKRRAHVYSMSRLNAVGPAEEI